MGGDDCAEAPADDQPGPAPERRLIGVLDHRRSRSPGRRRADHALGSDRLRSACREGADRARDHVVLRGRVAGLFLHVCPADQSEHPAQSGACPVPHRGRRAVRGDRHGGAAGAVHVRSGGLRAAPQPVVRHRGDVPRSAGRRRARHVLRHAARCALEGRARIRRGDRPGHGVVPGRGRDGALLRDVHPRGESGDAARECDADVFHRCWTDRHAAEDDSPRRAAER